MEKQRFVEIGSSSFFGEYLYKGGGVVGRPPFDPALQLECSKWLDYWIGGECAVGYDN